MTFFQPILILLCALLAVFWQGAFPSIRHLLGAQIDLLPPLMVYAALSASLVTMTLLAVVGGLMFDSLSANPLGTSVLPLFLVGLAIHWRRDLILRDQFYAQFILGLMASIVAPALSVLLLLTLGQTPLLGWGSLWQWLVLAVSGAVASPVLFAVFGWCHQLLGYRRIIETSFRPDREIRRGRN